MNEALFGLKEAPVSGHSWGLVDVKLALLGGSCILAGSSEVRLHENT